MSHSKVHSLPSNHTPHPYKPVEAGTMRDAILQIQKIVGLVQMMHLTGCSQHSISAWKDDNRPDKNPTLANAIKMDACAYSIAQQTPIADSIRNMAIREAKVVEDEGDCVLSTTLLLQSAQGDVSKLVQEFSCLSSEGGKGFTEQEAAAILKNVDGIRSLLEQLTHSVSANIVAG